MMHRGTPAHYFKSLNRPILMLGVDRSLFFLLVGLCLPIAFSAHLAPLMDCIAALCFLIGYGAGVLITRIDPHILAIYRRHIRYRKYYAAQPGLHAKQPLLRPSVPIYNGQRGLL